MRVQEPAAVTLLCGPPAAHCADCRPCRARVLPPPPPARMPTRTSPAAGNHRWPPAARVRRDHQAHTRPPRHAPRAARAGGTQPPPAHCRRKVHPPSLTAPALSKLCWKCRGRRRRAVVPMARRRRPLGHTRTGHGNQAVGVGGASGSRDGVPPPRGACIHGATPPSMGRPPARPPPVRRPIPPCWKQRRRDGGGRPPRTARVAGTSAEPFVTGARHGATRDDSWQRLLTATGVPGEWSRPRAPPPPPPPPHPLLHPRGGETVATTRAVERGSPPMQDRGAAAAALPVVSERRGRCRHRRAAADSATTLKTFRFDTRSKRDLSHPSADDLQ